MNKSPVKYVELNPVEVEIPERGPQQVPCSAELKTVYDNFMKPHQDIPLPADLPDRIKEEARAILAHYLPWAAPVGSAVLRRWLDPVLPSVRKTQPRTDAENKQWMTSMITACEALPRGAFTADSQAEFLRGQTFIPSAADIANAVSYRCNQITERIRVLQMIVRTRSELPRLGRI